MSLLSRAVLRHLVRMGMQALGLVLVVATGVAVYDLSEFTRTMPLLVVPVIFQLVPHCIKK